MAPTAVLAMPTAESVGLVGPGAEAEVAPKVGFGAPLTLEVLSRGATCRGR
jgi:hypothetical protein